MRTYVNWRRRSGAAAVKMALFMPILGFILIGMFELSRGIMVKQVLTGAARKGSHTGILQLYGNSNIISDATNVMQDNGFDSTLFNPTTNGNSLPEALNALSGSTISVQVVMPVTSVK